MIEVLGVSRTFGEIEAVREVTFSIPGPGVTGLLGPNGAGKTTIMRILTCSLFPTSGTATVAGHDVIQDPLAVKRSVGYLPENTPLYPDMTVTELLKFMAEARGLSGSARKESMDRVCAECGLADVRHRGMNRLSRGFRQRVGLAQALLHDPSVLILDEPTSGLDPGQIAGVRELIGRLGAARTVVLSSHILSEVEATCGRFLFLARGRIVAEGTREEIERGLGKDTTLEVILRVPGDRRVELQELAALPGVRRIMASVELPGGDVRVELAVQADGGAEVGVFDWAGRAGVKIVSLVPRRVSMEDMFLTLTE